MKVVREIFPMLRETPHPITMWIKTQCITKELLDTIYRLPTEPEVAINSLCNALAITIASNDLEEKKVAEKLVQLTEYLRGRIQEDGEN